jgi:uncharacterized protein
MIGNVLAALRNGASAFLIGGVRCYQIALRPIMPAVCRFQPSCSEYFILAVRKYGPVGGACRGAYRLCRCNPFTRGGYDPP